MTKAIDIMTGLNNNAEFVSIRQEKESDKRGCCKMVYGHFGPLPCSRHTLFIERRIQQLKITLNKVF